VSISNADSIIFDNDESGGKNKRKINNSLIYKQKHK